MAVSRALIEANKKYHALPSKEKEKSGALKKLYDEEIVKEAKPVIKVGDDVFTIKAGEDVLNSWMESLQNHTSVATEQINVSSPYSNFINSSIIVVAALIITILSTVITVQYKQKTSK